MLFGRTLMVLNRGKSNGAFYVLLLNAKTRPLSL